MRGGRGPASPRPARRPAAWVGLLLIGLLAAPSANAQQAAKEPAPARKRTGLWAARRLFRPIQPLVATPDGPRFRAADGRVVVPFPDVSDLEAGDLVAYENNDQFTYVVLDLSRAYKAGGAPAAAPRLVRRLFLFKPSTLLVEDQVQAPAGTKEVRWTLAGRGKPEVARGRVTLAGPGARLVCRTLLPKEAAQEQSGTRVDEVVPPGGAAAARFLHVVRSGRRGKTGAVEARLVGGVGGAVEATVKSQGNVYRLTLPAGRLGPGTLEKRDNEGARLLGLRLLPSGVLPPAYLVQEWDRPYRVGPVPWDTGRPSPELKKLVKDGKLRPGRLVDLGCGSGLNAVYLAGKGFDVTAIDIAPTALTQGMTAAEQAKVKVRWLLASVLDPPALEPFDIVFDRGCYHTFAGEAAPTAAYVETVRRYARPGTRFVLLAHTAPEKVRADWGALFEVEHVHKFIFDRRPDDPKERQGHLWIMRRKAAPGPGKQPGSKPGPAGPGPQAGRAAPGQGLAPPRQRPRPPHEALAFLRLPANQCGLPAGAAVAR
jgi:SAM-dependent methyltransferase